MKLIDRDILPYQENQFFSAIRDKLDYAKLIMYSARSLLLDYPSTGFVITSRMCLLVDSYSRLFFFKDNKFFSVAFPLTVVQNSDETLEISTYSGKVVDSQSISAVLSILDNENFKLKPSTMDYVFEADEMEALGLSLLEEIFLFESSYIRYDNDPIRANGKRHPLHHLDINYTSSGTYKIGLNNVIDLEYFKNILNTSTDCSFLVE